MVAKRTFAGSTDARRSRKSMSAWSALPSADTPTVRPARSSMRPISPARPGAVTAANSGKRPVVAKRRISAPRP